MWVIVWCTLTLISPPSLHHGESSLLICPEQQELIIEASQTRFCVCNFCQMCRKGCVCVFISVLWSRKLSVYFIVLGSIIQSAFMHIKHFYYTNYNIKFTSLSDTFPEYAVYPHLCFRIFTCNPLLILFLKALQQLSCLLVKRTNYRSSLSVSEIER